MQRLSHNKLCTLEDFANDQLVRVMRRELPHEVARFGEAFPRGHEDRRDWETAMTIRTFEDHGLLDGKHDFLGIAAGTEPLIFCLTRYAHRVFATDLYLEPGTWSWTAVESMLTEPGKFWTADWEPRRLVVQHMNALDLQYDDESFDGVFSSSSIEHFGDYEALHRAMDEMFRVLRPGGIAAFTTEYRFSGPPPGIPGTLMFDDEEVMAHLVGNRPWHPVSPLDLTMSDETVAATADSAELVAWQNAELERAGGIHAIRPEYPRYPIIALRSPSGHVSTTMHLALRRKRRNPIKRMVRQAVSLGRRVTRRGRRI